MGGACTAVLVIRAWTEPGAPGVRARLIETDRVGGRDKTVVVAGAEAISEAVRVWLEPLVAAAGDRDGRVTER
jgi:hypothetical protein